MKKELKIIIICMIIYTANRLLKNYIDVPILGYICKCHLNDLLGGIVFCAYVNVILIKSNKKTLTKYWELFIMIFSVGIIWEYVFPLILSYSVSDPFDVIFYILGATVYYFINLVNKEKMKIWV